MKNSSLVQDYIKRANIRLKAIQVLMDNEGYADVVRESQEVVELTLKALLRHSNIDTPRIHDVSNILIEEKMRLPKTIHKDVSVLTKISHSLRRDRELAFYGTEDLTPSEFYKKDDAIEALAGAKKVYDIVYAAISKELSIPLK